MEAAAPPCLHRMRREAAKRKRLRDSRERCKRERCKTRPGDYECMGFPPTAHLRPGGAHSSEYAGAGRRRDRRRVGRGRQSPHAHSNDSSPVQTRHRDNRVVGGWADRTRRIGRRRTGRRRIGRRRTGRRRNGRRRIGRRRIGRRTYNRRIGKRGVGKRGIGRRLENRIDRHSHAARPTAIIHPQRG